MKIYISLVICGCIWMLVRYSAGSVNPGQDDFISGMYYLYGTKTSTIYPCTFTCSDMDPYVDIASVASVVNIRRVEGKTDTLLFYGLPGADEGKYGIYFGILVFSDHLFPIDTYSWAEEYRAYAHITGHAFEIDIMSAGPRYLATGTLENGTIEIEGQYRYRNRTFEYHLKGEKIE